MTCNEQTNLAATASLVYHQFDAVMKYHDEWITGSIASKIYSFIVREHFNKVTLCFDFYCFFPVNPLNGFRFMSQSGGLNY